MVFRDSESHVQVWIEEGKVRHEPADAHKAFAHIGPCSMHIHSTGMELCLHIYLCAWLQRMLS